MNMQGNEINKADVAASFQQAVVEVLTSKAVLAAKKNNTSTLCLAGGVAANSALREEMENMCLKNGIRLLYPNLDLCTDNAAMIACCGYYEYVSGVRHDISLNAIPSLKIGEKYSVTCR